MGMKPRSNAGKNPDVRTYTDKRKISPSTQLLLIAKSGGRCALSNTYLFRDPLTGKEANYAQRAHIVGFSPGAARADETLKGGIHSIDNLMLLCYSCHKTVDDVAPEEYPESVLQQKNTEHRERIAWLTDIAPSKKTQVIKLTARVNSDITEASDYDIACAVAPLYPALEPIKIDLTTIPGNPESIALAASEVSKKLTSKFATSEVLGVEFPISVFAIGPIPLLVHLGHQLSNKVRIDLYQKHRDTENWSWKREGPIATFSSGVVREGDGSAGVALVLSLSGKIHLHELPEAVAKATVYEICLAEEPPNPGFLGRKESLAAFRSVYRSAISTIQQRHGSNTPILLFPAVPAPVAVCCGLDLLPKVHPPLHVYDNDKARGGFTLQHKVLNDNKQQ
tara:strand:+ start:126509 stop:127690 length:1182 start_codon:yes stop_codon:yes gene_type:complete